MLYHLFDYIEHNLNIPGAGLFQFISFRAAASVIISLVISMLFGKRIIRMLHRLQVGETVRDLGLNGQKEKEGTPTMGGLILFGAIMIPVLLFGRLDNVYIQLLLVSTTLMALIGGIDDYIKVFKKDKKGLAGKFKVLGQVLLGIIVGSTIFFNKDIVTRNEIPAEKIDNIESFEGYTIKDYEGDIHYMVDEVKPVTTIPFVKDNSLDYSTVFKIFGDEEGKWSWLFYIPLVIFIVTAVSNGANMTDGLDGLATGTSAIIGSTLGIFAYVSGNVIFSNYLNIMYIPNSGEIVIFIAAFIGACVGFLWYNNYPAQVFMGDTGSLMLGGVIAALAVILRKELLIPVLCGIFLVENLSVILQVAYFKYTKRRLGEGKRIFKMAPLHHHYQKLGYHESKIVSRFWIIGIMLAVVTIATLKIR
ncbi:MAG: phospho-N-acetylmuramoyl-pentapeptide-transferase [Chitinophagales bacterium]|nr:phospho-N-acetylmuramoyl-pentapeptide-transferase [Chitinophagales bacterium]